MRVDPGSPGAERRGLGERLVLDEDRMEAVVVAVGQAENRVLEERKRHYVGDAELAVEIVAPGEQALEDLERGPHAPAELRDPRGVWRRALLLVRDQVRRALPDVVEPVDEDLHLGATGGIPRVERRLGRTPLEP